MWVRLCVSVLYLERVVRVDAAPPAFLQLHLRVEVLLVLLHDVGQVGAAAALRVVLLTVAVVRLQGAGRGGGRHQRD